jgi:hypothetical protein
MGPPYVVAAAVKAWPSANAAPQDAGSAMGGTGGIAEIMAAAAHDAGKELKSERFACAASNAAPMTAPASK